MVTSNRLITISLSDDLNNVFTFAASPNTDSPGVSYIYDLVLGPNTITLPGGGTIVKAATIVPPEGNLLLIILKGVAGDTGIPLNLTDPLTITFPTISPPVSFILDAEDDIEGLRIIWS